jgi:hypothetical protein
MSRSSQMHFGQGGSGRARVSGPTFLHLEGVGFSPLEGVGFSPAMTCPS